MMILMLKEGLAELPVAMYVVESAGGRMCRAAQSCISPASNCLQTPLLNQLLLYVTPYPHLGARLGLLYVAAAFFWQSPCAWWVALVAVLGVGKLRCSCILHAATHKILLRMYCLSASSVVAAPWLEACIAPFAA
jgi:hypothetical protein